MISLGKKLLGPGARSMLPTFDEVKTELGSNIYSIALSLDNKVEKASF